MYPRDEDDLYIAPSTIFLQVQESEVSWCVDQIHDTDIEYTKLRQSNPAIDLLQSYFDSIKTSLDNFKQFIKRNSK